MLQRPPNREFTLRSLLVLMVATAGVLGAHCWLVTPLQLLASLPWTAVALLLVVTRGDVLLGVLLGAASTWVLMLLGALLLFGFETPRVSGFEATFFTGWPAALAGSVHAIARGYLITGSCVLLACLLPCCLGAMVAP